jgi:hypothetical protein
MKSATIAVDLAKSVFQVAVSHRPGKVAESHRLTRSQFERFFAERQPALVLLEACGSALFLGSPAGVPWAQGGAAAGYCQELCSSALVEARVSGLKAAN